MDGVGKLSRKKSDYFDLMRKPTEQYVDNELEERYAVFKQKSELKKPYREEAFQEMEYKSFDWPYHKPPPAPPWPKPQPLPKPKPSPEPEPWPEPQPPPEGKVPPTPPWPERQPPPKGEPPPWTPWKLPPWPPWPKPQPWFVPYWGPGAGGWGAGSGSWGPGAGSWGPGSEGWGPDGDWGWNIRCVGCIITTQDKTCYNSCDDCYGEAHVSKACFKGHPSTNRNGQQYTWKVEGGNLKQITYYGNAICTDELFSGDSGGWGNGIKIYPNWDKIESDGDWKKANYTITLIDGLGYKCRDKIQLKCPSCVCEETPNVAYDDANSDDTIDRNGTATIVVKDGCPPFSWSVSGTGFSIPASSEGRTNILSADDTACGTATITVTDHCGDSCSGYVRGTEGQWVLKSIGTCVISGVGTFTGTTGTPERYCYEYIVGNKKQTQETKYEATGNYSGPCPAGGACLDYCSGAACEECVGNGDHPIPCEDAPTEELPHRIICWSNYNLYYFEWEC